VTDRRWFEGASSTFTECGLTHEMIDDIPQNGKILFVGSGLYRALEKEILHHRVDLLIVSVDPTLGLIDTESCEESPYTINVVANWSYTPKSQKHYEYKTPDGEVIDMQRERLKRVIEIPGAVAALAPDLPFADGVFDMVIDVKGPALYLPTKLLQQYRDELYRITTPYAQILLSD